MNNVNISVILGLVEYLSFAALDDRILSAGEIMIS